MAPPNRIDLNRSEIDHLFTDGDLTTLVDLQKFLADELTEGVEKGVDLSRAFMPLTDGLGIQSNKPKASPARVEKTEITPSSLVKDFGFSEDEIAAEPSAPARRLIVDPEVEHLEKRSAEQFATAATPPPVPAPSLFRRFCASVVDQGFVLTAWLLALAITSNAMSGGAGELSTRFLREFTSPAFVRFASLEFGVIWLAYLALSLGFLEMTFGMWVWGLRVNYGETGRFWKKIARVILGVLIYPAVLPSALLCPRKQGQNLIDSLTHSEIYRSSGT